MKNLLTETIAAIEDSGHRIEDITFIGSEQSGHSCSWDEFVKLADKVYNSGAGAQEVASDLIVVFSDGQKMWRGEYDGFEWWEYSTPFIDPNKQLKITELFSNVGWKELSEFMKIPEHMKNPRWLLLAPLMIVVLLISAVLYFSGKMLIVLGNVLVTMHTCPTPAWIQRVFKWMEEGVK